MLTAVALGVLLIPLNTTMIAIALPEIGKDFGVSVSKLSLLVSTYLVAMVVVLSIAGKVGDRFGRRKVFLTALILFTACSIGAALAPTFNSLIVWRMLQAALGAAAMPSGNALIREWAPERQRGMAFGVMGAAIGLSAALGPPLSGVLVELTGWRGIFWANIPPGILAVIVGWALIPRTPPAATATRFDFAGAAVLAATLTLGAMAAQTIGGASLVLPFALGGAAILAALLFVRLERRAEEPVIHMGLFRNPYYVAILVSGMLGNVAIFVLIFVMPQFLSGVQERSDIQIGAILAVFTLPMVVLSPLGGWLADLKGRHVPALMGSAIIFIASMTFIFISGSWSLWAISAVLVVFGIGVSLQTPALQVSAAEAAGARDSGMASGVYLTGRFWGSLIGIGSMGAILGSAGLSTSELTASALLPIFIMMGVAAAASLAALSFVRLRA